MSGKLPKDLKIGVLGGGVSGEREISLSSARQVYEALCRQETDTAFIDINTTSEAKIRDLILSEKVKAVFIALHGEFGEDGQIQSIIEKLNIPYAGSSPQASLLSMDKYLSKKIFTRESILTPDFTVCTNPGHLPGDFNTPLVVKPNLSGSSLGVKIVREKSNLKKALEEAFSFGEKVIVEKYIKGRELTVGILGEEALPVVEIVPKNEYFDFEAKYTDGRSEFVCPAELQDGLSREIKKVALRAHKALGCRHFSRVDMILGEDKKIYVLEINSIPGLTSHSLLPLAAKTRGMSFDDLVLTIVEMVIHGKKKTQKTQKV
ncbi:MAG: D-alanine--D-alanine ligase [Candidatus Omnitrophica bacterium]|nr:D-alanine--D-alanine ligase [Candidatus Omnitrophota bacterium]MBD3269538.1 D-alanine--D-alanine ligase [Candidatus Omnitrophota bacterium]